MCTRFPPEPNGYLHIGHAKSICLNFGVAADFAGLCNLRFDDTNPTKEDVEYVDSIQEDVRWLGFDWGERMFYASDYFESLYRYAEQLIQDGKAYVDSLTADEIRELPRNADRAGPEQSLPGTRHRREPRPVSPDAGGRVSRRCARVAREDRHGLAEHEHAGSHAVPHPARHPSPDG